MFTNNPTRTISTFDLQFVYSALLLSVQLLYNLHLLNTRDMGAKRANSQKPRAKCQEPNATCQEPETFSASESLTLASRNSTRAFNSIS